MMPMRRDALLDMDEHAFRQAWESIVGGPPAILLPRREMIAILEQTAAELPDPSPDPACRGSRAER